ncbi:MAG TPA: hypothetical protein VE690_17680 [Rhodopila sp.]|nr:hypothetical protein [Rhodopila sp.]
MRRLLLVALMIMPFSAQAQPAAQLAGLFIQGCVPFAGNSGALRDWARRQGLRAAPEPVRRAFLHSTPGQVFDGSAPEAKLALISSDAGLCSVATDTAKESDVIAALEAGLRQAGLAFRLVIERNDKQVPQIHEREYLAAKGGKGWRILAAAVNGDAGGEAMLTAGPE